MKPKLDTDIEVLEAEAVEVQDIVAMELVQLPEIKEQLGIVKNEIEQHIASLNIDSLEATEENKQKLKNHRASLNSKLKRYEEARKNIKKGILTPYEIFERIFNDCVKDPIDEAVKKLSPKINSIEIIQKEAKIAELNDHFDKITKANNIDWLKLYDILPKVDLAPSINKYKDQITTKVEEIKSDIESIETLDFATEILVEYKKSLQLAPSITLVKNRKASEKAEAERLQFERKQKRERQLQSLSFVTSDARKMMYFISDENINISLVDIENLSDDDFNRKVLEFKNQTRPKEEAKKETPILQAPIEKSSPIDNEEEVFEASFKVTGTKDQLLALSAYLKSNNLNYINL